MKGPGKAYWYMLSRYLGPLRRSAILLALLLFSGVGLQLINPQIIRYFIDTASAGGSTRILVQAAVMFILVALLQRAVKLASDLTSQEIGWKATNALRRDLALHVLRLDMSFHKQRTPGELIERVDGDVTALTNYFSRFIIQILGSGLLIVGILFFLFREDMRVGFWLTFYVLVVLTLLIGIHRPGVTRWNEARQAIAEQYGFIEERISGAEEIRALGAEPYVMQRLYSLMGSYLEKIRAAYLFQTLLSNLANLLYTLGYAIGLTLGVTLYGRGEASLGAAYLIVFYIGMLSEPLTTLQEQARDFHQASASIGRIEELFAFRSQVKEREATNAQGGPWLPTGALPVHFKGVTFFYDGNGSNGNVLEEVDFKLEAGRVLGVVGRTGSGKSTLTRLLFRLYDPVHGSIHLNGIDIRGLPFGELRARVGMVTQEVQLFHGTLRDNLALFNPSIGDTQIQAALKELRLENWLAGLPQGLDTPLQAGGGGLSAGEAQLLAFARVLLKDPGLVILDEASSRLDPASELLLEQAISRLFAGRTAIVIAHRLQTVQRADEILVLEAGKVIEFGSRRALATDPGSRFQRLLQTGLEEVLV